MNDNKIVLGFIGKIATGKGLAVEYLKSKYDADVFKFSDFLRRVLADIEMPETRENIQKISFLLREFAGQDILSRLMFSCVQKSEKNLCLIDGVRRLSDILPFRGQPNFFLVAVTADSEIRFSRVLSREENQGDSQKTKEEFLKEDEAETEKTIDEVIKTANVVIENNGSKEAFLAKLDKFVSDLIASVR